MEIRKKRKLRFRIDELSVTVLFRITVELSYLRFRNPEIRIEFGIQRFHIPRFIFLVSYIRFRNTGLILEVSYSKLHIQRFRMEEGELMRHSIDNDTYQRKEIANPNNNTQTILEPINKLSQQHQKQYYVDIKVMNYIIQGIPNDIYNSVDACKDENHMEQDQKIDASPSYSRSPQPYYVTYPSLVIDSKDDYQGEIQGDAQEDKLSTAMMLLTRAITQHYSTLTNNRLHTSLNTRNQDVIQDGRVDIQSKNVGYAGNGNRNAGRTNRNQEANAGNGLVQKIEEYDQNVQRVPITESIPGKTNMLLATKDEARVHLDEEENNFMLMNAYGDDMLEELNASMIMMACIQPIDEKSDVEPTYDAELINEVNASHINRLLSKSDHEHRHHEKLKTIIHTSADDQIDSDIIFDDPYVDNNSGQAEHDTNANDQPFFDFESQKNNVQIEAENQRRMNIELQKQKALLQREHETKEWVKEFENKPDQFIYYKSANEDLQNEISVEKENLYNKKEEIQDQFLKTHDETLKIRNETESFKKAFKERENKYLEDIVTLEEKLKSHDQIVFRMSHSFQTIHMLGKKPNKFYDPHTKTGLGYQNSERLKKAIATQPKIYNGNNINNNKLKINLPNYEETLEDAKESRLKMKDKMILLDYPKVNEMWILEKEKNLK
ncbi:hypothetical protein Tco_0799828 [Tanacetum coccineum]|uniref:Uncharacterized protein n=1 Tax=Tanacetum coccineum TaxID=301880 RepID=A0ABQ4ZV49_9ASTR